MVEIPDNEGKTPESLPPETVLPFYVRRVRDYLQQDFLGKTEASLSRLMEGLSPDVVQRILEKCSDVQTKGTTFHVLRFIAEQRELSKILTQGILGGGQGMWMEMTVDAWKERAKKHKSTFVAFNIVGRSCPDIKNSFYWKGDWAQGNRGKKIAILFNTDGLSEDPPSDNPLDIRPGHFIGIFQPYETFWRKFYPTLAPGDPAIKKDVEDGCWKGTEYEKYLDADGKPISDYSRWGFSLSPRVAPRKFSGLVLQGEFAGPQSPFIGHLCSVVQTMREACAGNDDALLPVYDENGNLWWPARLSMEEIRKLLTVKK